MDNSVNELEEYIYGVTTAPAKQQYNYTLAYFKQQRVYKQLTLIYFALLLFRLLYSLYEVFAIFSPLIFNTYFIVKFLDNIMFLIVCYESIIKLTWSNKNHLIYFLLGNTLIVSVRFSQSTTYTTTFRVGYMLILIIIMMFINWITSKLIQTALLLKPDEDNPEARFTV